MKRFGGLTAHVAYLILVSAAQGTAAEPELRVESEYEELRDEILVKQNFSGASAEVLARKYGAKSVGFINSLIDDSTPLKARGVACSILAKIHAVETYQKDTEASIEIASIEPFVLASFGAPLPSPFTRDDYHGLLALLHAIGQINSDSCREILEMSVTEEYWLQREDLPLEGEWRLNAYDNLRSVRTHALSAYASSLWVFQGISIKESHVFQHLPEDLRSKDKVDGAMSFAQGEKNRREQLTTADSALNGEFSNHQRNTGIQSRRPDPRLTNLGAYYLDWIKDEFEPDDEAIASLNDGARDTYNQARKARVEGDNTFAYTCFYILGNDSTLTTPFRTHCLIKVARHESAASKHTDHVTTLRQIRSLNPNNEQVAFATDLLIARILHTCAIAPEDVTKYVAKGLNVDLVVEFEEIVSHYESIFSRYDDHHVWMILAHIEYASELEERSRHPKESYHADVALAHSLRAQEVIDRMTSDALVRNEDPALVITDFLRQICSDAVGRAERIVAKFAELEQGSNSSIETTVESSPDVLEQAH